MSYLPCPARYQRDGIPKCSPSGKSCLKMESCEEYLGFLFYHYFTPLRSGPPIVEGSRDAQFVEQLELVLSELVE